MVTPPNPNPPLPPPPPPPPPPRTWQWHAKRVLALALVLTLVILFFFTELPGSRYAIFDKCADGVEERGEGDECVGVTDGAYVFDPYLKDVIGLIHEENRNVERSGKPWVSLAYLQPMTLTAGDRGRESIRQELEGAFLSQHALNRHSEGGRGEEPQIKLLLANPGAGGGQWRAVSADLIAMKDDAAHRLVGVAGFGQSLATTQRAIDLLRTAGLPLMGSGTTADSFTSGTTAGFFRIVPPNKDEASAAAKYLREEQGRRPGYRVAVVRDRNGKDLYASSLYEGFAASAGRTGLKLRELGLAYDSSEPGTDSAFSSIADRVCQDRTEALYFAGRGLQLRQFVEAMAAGGRRCKVTVYTGDDAVGIDDRAWSEQERAQFAARWSASGTTLRYTALAHPQLWATGYPGGKADPFPEFRDRYRALTGRNESQLLNGVAITGYDAVLTAGVAIRNAGRTKVSAGAVRQMMLQITGSNAVPGISGPIGFAPNGDPQSKSMSLVEMRPTGAYVFLTVVRP